MTRHVFHTAIVAAMLSAMASIGAGDVVTPDHPIVAAFERFHSQPDIDVDADADSGELLLGELGCIACHAPPSTIEDRLQLKEAPRLTDAGGRISYDYFKRFIGETSRVKPGTTMPDVLVAMNGSAKQAAIEALAQFLVSLGGPVPASVDVAGDELVNKGARLYHRVGCVACHEPKRPATSMDTTDAPDSYSDPSSNTEAPKMTWPSVPLGNLAGKTSVDALASFLRDPLVIRPSGRMPDMKLNDAEVRAIAAYLIRDSKVSSDAKEIESAPRELDPRIVVTGRAQFEQLGCAACHAVEIDGKRLRSNRSAPPLNELRPGDNKGCLSKEPATGAVHYPLTAAQRRALVAGIARIQRNKTNVKPAPDEIVKRTMMRMNCYACHVRDGVGGPDAARRAYFGGEHATDIGDEARLPPDLTGVGAKLTRDGFEAVFNGAGDVRPFMHTRMPRFGVDNVNELIDAFEQSDRDSDPPAINVSGLLLHHRNRYGRQLLGDEGLRCITCHALRGHASTGAPGVDLANAPRRLQPTWFKRYLLNPAALRPDTRMPAFWENGKSAATNVLGGDADRQVEAIWVYLREIDQTRLPVGMERGEQYELVPTDRPIVHRTFMKDIGAAAIAVGFPAHVNIAFDALSVRTALAWRGRFISAESAWSDRFTPFVSPLSDDRYTFPDAMPFAVLKDDHALWPATFDDAAGYRMKGYRLDKDGTPVFLYRFGTIDIEETLRPTTDGRGVLRTWKLASTDEHSCWLLAARGKSIRARNTGGYVVDDKCEVIIHTPPNAQTVIVNGADGISELRVKITWTGASITIAQEVRW